MVAAALVAALGAGCGSQSPPDAPPDASIADAGTPDPPPEPYDPPPEFRVAMERDLAQYVDPMIGSDGSGNVIPGALVPHGMVRASPDTRSAPGRIGAYEYGDARIEGFSHRHLEGPGGSGNGYNQVRLMPVAGAVDFTDFSSAYSHDTEEAEPGYYAVTLDDGDIRVELAAAARSAMHRYTFPAGEASVVMDLFRSAGTSRGMAVEIVGDRVVRGRARYNMHPALNIVLGRVAPGTGETEVFFHAEFSKPFSRLGTWLGGDTPSSMPDVRDEQGFGLGAYVGFDVTEGEVVEVRVGISLVDRDQAQRNLEEELGGRGFDEVRAAAREAWNAKLNRIQVEGSDEVLTAFYTALYHSLFQPASYTEVGGRYVVATSGEPHIRNGGGRPFYSDDWCMWDTFRTLHPLGTLVEPEIRSDIVRSMLTMYEEGGWLPKCTWSATGYSRVMTGSVAIPIIVDAWEKGLRDFDSDLAWDAMLKASTEEVEGLPDGGCGYFGVGTPPEYESLGYFGYECDPHQAASMTLEYAYTDFCMERFAASTGRETDRERFAQRSRSYENQWNPATGFMQPRLRDGSWLEPFDPAETRDANGFVEASAWIFSFFVPHDVPALIALHGGDVPFLDRLDRFYDEGHFDPGNQPSFHIAWLYNYAGAPHRTQARVREIMDREFGVGPDGLPGNDDAGSMSALLALAMLGIYPVAPGALEYQLSTPMVDRAVIHLNPAHYPGGTFTVEVEGGGSGAIYIQSATLNGAPLERPWISHDEITAGGTLRYLVGTEPSSWGT